MKIGGVKRLDEMGSISKGDESVAKKLELAEQISKKASASFNRISIGILDIVDFLRSNGVSH